MLYKKSGGMILLASATWLAESIEQGNSSAQRHLLESSFWSCCGYVLEMWRFTCATRISIGLISGSETDMLNKLLKMPHLQKFNLIKML